MFNNNNESHSNFVALKDVFDKKTYISDWKDLARKKLRDSGEAYISRKKNVLVPAKKPPEKARICEGQKCHKQGCLYLTLDMKLNYYKRYYTMDYNEQTLFLISLIQMHIPAKRCEEFLNTEKLSRKMCTFRYYIDGKEVCKATLLDIFSITHRRIQTIQLKLKEGNYTPKDQRGKHCNRSNKKRVNKLKNMKSSKRKQDDLEIEMLTKTLKEHIKVKEVTDNNYLDEILGMDDSDLQSMIENGILNDNVSLFN